MDRRGSDLSRHASDGGSNGRAGRHHAAAGEGIRLERRRHLLCACPTHRALRADGAVFGRLHQPLRRPARRHCSGSDDLSRHSGLAGDDRGLAARRAVGRHCRRRHRPGRPGARRNGRDALVRRASRPCRRHAGGEQRDRPAHFPAVSRQGDAGLRVAQRACLRRRDAARGRPRRALDAARPAGRRRPRALWRQGDRAAPRAGPRPRRHDGLAKSTCFTRSGRAEPSGSCL
jgi:hypothetical protein